MARRAVLRFSPLEYLYQDTYGIMPDYDIDRHVRNGMDRQQANDLVNSRMNGLWQQMKYEHEHENGFRPIQSGDGCPF